ncbi:hypothetical protein PF010_g13314 [Phytophthora fragariae]|uniref:Uncharacterized protein n=1 Tax=Phytophthora fragariae TaxID=53985 RepID=A0A6G0L0H1_9STRA|nr:hypothetical protein PF010_g13314 [Phytophthora fragariae]
MPSHLAESVSATSAKVAPPFLSDSGIQISAVAVAFSQQTLHLICALVLLDAVPAHPDGPPFPPF